MKTAIVIIVLLLVLVVGGLFYIGQKSRSGKAPGLSGGQLAACPSSPNCVSSESGTPQEKRVAPLSRQAWPQIPAAVEAMGGTVTRQDSDYLAAEFRSKWFGFTDDVEFRRADDIVHVRSASRVGHSDMGVNRKRVEEFKDRLGNS